MINPSFITFPIFEKYPNIFCAFSTRIGGFSEDKYSTMNMGLTSGDNIDIVKKNRKKWFDLFKIDENKIAIPKQIHSASVKKVKKAGIYADTDALITNNQDILLSVQTADCLPIFMFEPEKNVITVIHAGWQGALKGIVSNTLDSLINEYKIQTDILNVAIGPGLQSSCFELREDVFMKFPDEFLIEHGDIEKKYLNLHGYIESQMLNYNIKKENIYMDLNCTHCQTDKFYSYRCDKYQSGRMMGIISFKNALNI